MSKNPISFQYLWHSNVIVYAGIHNEHLSQFLFPHSESLNVKISQDANSMEPVESILGKLSEISVKYKIRHSLQIIKFYYLSTFDLK